MTEIPEKRMACRNISLPKKNKRGANGFIVVYENTFQRFLLDLSCPSWPFSKRWIFSRCLYINSDDNRRKMKNIDQTGLSSCTQGTSRNNHGRTASIVIAERLEIRFHKYMPAHARAAQMPTFNCKIAKTPNKVEIPFPPLKRRKTEKTCPQTTVIPARL